MAVAGTPADCVRLALHHLAPAAELGLGRDQRRRQPGHGHSLLGDGRGRSRSGHPRRSRNRPVALYRPRAGHRLGPGRTLGGGDPAPADGTTMGTGHILERQSPPPRARAARPRRRFLPARPVPPAPSLPRRGRPVDLRGRLPVARAPAGVRRRRLFRRQDRRHLDPDCRRSRSIRPSLARAGRSDETDLPVRASRSKRPREKVWPTWARACHNVVIWAVGGEPIASSRWRSISGHPAAVIILHRFVCLTGGGRIFHEDRSYSNCWCDSSGWRSAGARSRPISSR